MTVSALFNVPVEYRASNRRHAPQYTDNRKRLLLLSGNGSSTSSSTTLVSTIRKIGNSRGLGVLTSDSQSPVVSKTSVRSDLLESLEIVSELLVDSVGEGVGVLSVGKVLLSVQEPSWDFELGGVLHDGDDSLELIRVELSGSDMSLGFLVSRK